MIVAAPRRGLTLFELLLGLALLTALGGLVFVSLQSVRDEARTRSAADRVDALIRDAHALAMRAGEPVAVLLDPDAGALRAEWLTTPVSSTGDPGTAGAATVTMGAVEDEDERLIPEPWARLALADGIRAWTTDPRRVLAEAGPLDELDDSLAEAAFDLPEADLEPIRLAVFLPDGTTLSTRRIWLVGPGDRGLEFHLHAWTGEPSWKPVDLSPDAIAVEDDGDGIGREVFDDDSFDAGDAAPDDVAADSAVGSAGSVAEPSR